MAPVGVAEVVTAGPPSPPPQAVKDSSMPLSTSEPIERETLFMD
ncbi:hypothetical protein [Nitrospira moscoviensis]|nr:hypothetical protein [Nitrospira moscoviensis]